VALMTAGRHQSEYSRRLHTPPSLWSEDVANSLHSITRTHFLTDTASSGDLPSGARFPNGTNVV
jgi:hypothetical protein